MCIEPVAKHACMLGANGEDDGRGWRRPEDWKGELIRSVGKIREVREGLMKRGNRRGGRDIPKVMIIQLREDVRGQRVERGRLNSGARKSQLTKGSPCFIPKCCLRNTMTA
jgi:hypothetical protein